MLKHYLIAVIFVLTSSFCFSQTIWEVSTTKRSKANTPNIKLSSNQTTYKFNKSAFLNLLQQKSPTQNTPEIKMPYGSDKAEFKTFKLQQVQTIKPDLSKSISSQILSFKGQSLNGHESIRITLTPMGLFGSIVGAEGLKYINPVDGNYLVLERNDFLNKGFACQNNDIITAESIENKAQQADDSTLRIYDLAVACTGEYAQFHIAVANAGSESDAVKKNIVQAAMVVTIDRVNQLYERDLGIQLQFVDNNEDLIFLDADTDPYQNNNSSQLININTTIIDNIIGSGAYSIGHVVSTGGGGVAALGSVCTASKGAGVTGLPNPIGDPFDVDYVAHEIGHQFGATHTFNNSCNGNRTSTTAFEPGSGQTIMAYAGICAPNIASNSVPFFHSASISQVNNFVAFGLGGTCSTNQAITNTPPSVQSIGNFTIPNSTPFKYDVVATDNENDNLTYTWEQLDSEISSQPPQTFSTEGPNFKYLPPTPESFRYFPKLETILNNQTGTTWEVLPSIQREMLFGVTVRDNNSTGGQVTSRITALDVAAVGPFRVTSQNISNITYSGNSEINVTWDVAGTTTNGINTSEVSILLSTDNGLSFSEVLINNTANDGSETVTIPNLNADNCRIMVQPIDNIYFAINTNTFRIEEGLSTNTFTPISFKMYPNPSNGRLQLEFGNSLNQVSVSIFNVRGQLVNKIKKTSTSKLALDVSSYSSGVYLVKIEANGKSLVKKLMLR